MKLQRDDDTDWMDEAACKGMTHLFFPTDSTGIRASETPAKVAPARAICFGCPVLERCQSYARRWREPFGVWGAESARDRRRAWQRESRLSLEAGLPRRYGPQDPSGL